MPIRPKSMNGYDEEADSCPKCGYVSQVKDEQDDTWSGLENYSLIVAGIMAIIGMCFSLLYGLYSVLLSIMENDIIITLPAFI
ncbi:MAG: hypothetical protein ACLFUS_11585 [Candidatus Sumerlaeia bacterium]